MKLFVGLGNPGARYAGNRHNIGFMAVDAIVRDFGKTPFRPRFQSLATEAVIGAEKVLLLKPQTYMNESGRAVGEALNFYKLGIDDLVVFHDELDLAPAKLRIKRGGGNAGHNGLRSITAHCGNDYWRVRLGIGHPGLKDMVHAYVLSDFGKAEAGWVDDLCRAMASAAPLLVSGQESAFASKVHIAMEAAGHKDVKRLGET